MNKMQLVKGTKVKCINEGSTVGSCIGFITDVKYFSDSTSYMYEVAFTRLSKNGSYTDTGWWMSEHEIEISYVPVL